MTLAIPDARDQFVSGRAAMMIGGSWLLPQLDEHPDLNYGVVPVPIPEGKEPVNVPTGGELWVISVDRQQGERQDVPRMRVEPGRDA